MTSTVISELVLALACGYCALMLWRFSPMQDRSWGALAALITALTALLGALKFGTSLPVDDWHRLAALLSRFVALPLMAVAWVLAAWHWPRSSGGRLLAVIVVWVLFVCHQWLWAIPLYSDWIAPISVALIALAALTSVWRHREYGLLGLSGAAQMLLAGQVVGVQGSINGFAAVDIFHYLLASAWLAMAVGLRHVD